MRTAFVTGAASGIGAAVARLFAENGDRVALFDVNSAGMERTISGLKGPAKHLALTGDVAIEADVARAIHEATASGPLDILVNNAAVEFNGTVVQQSFDDWNRQLAVNIGGMFLCSKYALPHLRRNGKGVIVNISSVHAHVSWPRCAAYDASKAAVLGLTRALAVDHGPEGIRINVICPGYIETPLLEQWFSGDVERRKRIADLHPLRRLGQPEDIAAAVRFLCSDEASFISGAVLTVDGGITALGH